MKKKPVSNKSGSSKRSLADLFDDTDSSEASNFPSAGEHEMRLNGFTVSKNKAKGTAVFMECEVIEGDEEGKKIRQMYKLTDAAGNKAPGMAYLKRDLELLGYEDVAGKKLEKTLKKISEEQPMIVGTVKESGQYTNFYLGGLVEDGVANDDDDEDEDEDEAPKKKKKGKGKKKVEEDEDEDEEDEDEDEDDEDDDDDDDDDEDDEDDDDEDDEDEDDEDKKPAKKKKGKKKVEEDEDEDEEDEDEDEDDEDDDEDEDEDDEDDEDEDEDEEEKPKKKKKK